MAFLCRYRVIFATLFRSGPDDDRENSMCFVMDIPDKTCLRSLIGVPCASAVTASLGGINAIIFRVLFVSACSAFNLAVLWPNCSDSDRATLSHGKTSFKPAAGRSCSSSKKLELRDSLVHNIYSGISSRFRNTAQRFRHAKSTTCT